MENSDLEAGLAALKQQNHSKAIAFLENVCKLELHKPTVYRAQMGLVVAYERNGNPKGAIALCENLTQSKNVKVKSWADSTLAKLVQRYPQLRSSSASSVQSQLPEIVNPPRGDRTGFMPLDPADGTEAATTANCAIEPQKSKIPKPPVPPPMPPIPKASIGDRGGWVRSKTAKPDRAKPTATSAIEPPSTVPQTPIDPESESLTQTEPITPKTQDKTPTIAQTAETGNSTVPQAAPQWRNAGRSTHWRPMKLVKPSRLFLTQIATAIVLFGFLRFCLNGAMGSINDLLYKLPLLWPIQAFYRDQSWTLLGILLFLWVASPWLIDIVLRQFYGLKPLSLQKLATYSPEARRLVPRFCFDRKLPMFSLGVLPTEAPMALSYGCLPRFARIVVSQGLLDQLEDDEIAAIYAGELGHIQNWDFPVLSVAVFLCQIPYLVYWQVANEGDQLLEAKSWYKKCMLALAGGISAVAYGCYWLLRWPVLLLSRLRLYYSDRTATSLTGNPNGLTRGLLKMAMGIAKDLEKNGQTSFAIEGFDLLNAIGYAQAISLGSGYGETSWETLLEWDRRNPYRKWLAINNSHPPIGERLNLLDLYARFWKLETELDFGNAQSSGVKITRPKFTKLLLQGAPFFGVPIGGVLGLLLWAIGAVAEQLSFGPLVWLWGDRAVLAGCLAIGLSWGIFSRINHLFPDIKPGNLANDPSLPDLLGDRAAIPLDSQPIRLEGKLLGRRGVSNWLGQDLIVQSARGLVKLHCFSNLGPLGYLWPTAKRPGDLVGYSIAVTGWFRRGATTWIDVETLTTPEGQTRHGGHPIWSTILAAVAALWGAYSISRGSLYW